MEKEREAGCVETLPACAKTYTHTPKHRPKCTYMEIPVYIYLSDIQLYRETEETPIITTPYSSLKKQRAKKCYSKKNHLGLLVSYTLYLFNKNNNGVILFLFVCLFYTIVRDSITTARSSY